jgi:hypothetical protein
MWVTFIATAVAASICLSTVNLASHLNKVRNAPLSPVIESIRPPSPAFPQRPQAATLAGQNNQENVLSEPRRTA